MDRYENFVKELPELTLNLLGLEFSRFMLFVINCGFIVVGTSLLLAVLYLSNLVHTWSWMIDCDATIIFLIIAGAVMLCVAFIGGLALIKQNVVIVNIYWLTLLILLVAEINAVITTAIIQANVYIKVENNMMQALKNRDEYDWNWQLSRWNDIQKHYDCCGVQGYKDWVSLNMTDGIKYYKDDYEYYGKKVSSGDIVVVPYSCCDEFINTRNSEVTCKRVIQDGCAKVINNRYISVGFVGLAIVAILTIILEIFGLIFASLHARNIRRFKTTEEMRRQEMQHLLYSQEGAPVLTSTD